jgi:hypothetical protein
VAGNSSAVRFPRERTVPLVIVSDILIFFILPTATPFTLMIAIGAVIDFDMLFIYLIF